MADFGIGSVGNIIKVGLAIQDAVETAQQNKEDCDEIKKRALRVNAILEGLAKNKMMDDNPATKGALDDLEKSFQNALTLITACQETHVMCLFWKAKGLSKKLRRAQDDIERKLMLGVFATNIQVTIMLSNIGCPPQSQNAGASSSDMTDDSRIETDIKDNNVIPAKGDTPFASFDGLTKFTWAEMKDATNGFSNDYLVGVGGFAIVYKGVLRDGQVVAIKLFHDSIGLSQKEIAKELDIISKVEHRNIVKCLGYANEPEKSFAEMGNKLMLAPKTHFCLVHKFMQNGVLERGRVKQADWSARLKLIDGIAQGLNYLHGQGILHMDLKPDNILLDSDMNAKIADFGISRMFDGSASPSLTRTTTTTNLAGTMGYMAPEYIFEGTISFKVDVYAFGIIVLGTIISGMCKGDLASVGASIEWAREARNKNNRQFRELFDPSLFHESQLKQIKSCLDMGLRCAERDPHKRPNMADVVEELDRIKDATAGSLKSPSLLRRLNTLTSEGRHK